MKNKLFLLLAFVLTITIVLALSVFANDSYTEDEDSYTVYTAEQYQEVIDGIYEGTIANKTIVLGCDIEVKYDFVMEKACNITIDLNQFTLKNTHFNPEKTGDFDFRHPEAVLNIKNGKIDSTFCVFVYRTSGQLYAQDLQISSQDECIYKYVGHSGVISLKNCKMDARGNYYAVCLSSCENKGGTLYQIEGGEYAGFCIHCALPGSYMRDCRIYEKELFIDSWHSHGANGSDSTVEIRNVEVEVQIRLNDRRMDPVLYDCTYPKVVIGGGQLITAYTSPDCENAGQRLTYDGSDVPVVDEQYSLDNPALGHNNQYIVAYDNGFLESGYVFDGCTRCDQNTTESLSPLFESLGYSVSESGTGIALGYIVDKVAVEKYESKSGKAVGFGIFATSQASLGDGDIFVNGEAAKGVITYDLSGESTDYFELKLVGFNTEAQRAAKLAFGAYVSVTGETVDCSYIQAEKPMDGQKYYFASYNDFVL